MSLMKKRRKQQMPELDLPSDSIMAQYDIMRAARGRSKSHKGPSTEGYNESQNRISHELDESKREPKSLQEDMIHDHSNDKENRSLELFDGRAERIDPFNKELVEDDDSIHSPGKVTSSQEDEDDIVSRIMRKMRRK